MALPVCFDPCGRTIVSARGCMHTQTALGGCILKTALQSVFRSNPSSYVSVLTKRCLISASLFKWMPSLVDVPGDEASGLLLVLRRIVLALR